MDSSVSRVRAILCMSILAYSRCPLRMVLETHSSRRCFKFSIPVMVLHNIKQSKISTSLHQINQLLFRLDDFIGQ